MRFIIFSFVLFLSAIPQLKASDTKLEPLPKPEAMTLEEFKQQACEIDVAVEGDKTLDFTMSLPKNFEARDGSILKNRIDGNRLYGVFFEADGPKLGGSPSYVRMIVHEVDRLISLKNWFIHQALQYNYTIKGMKLSDDGLSLDVFYIRLDMNGGTEIVRSKLFKHSGRFVEVNYVVPSSKWATDRDVQIYAMDSFSLNELSVGKAIEDIAEYSYLDTIYLQYPKSWVFRTDRTEYINQLKLYFATSDINDFLIAQIEMDIISRKSLRDRVDQTIFPVDLSETIKAAQNILSEQGYEADPVRESKVLNIKFPTSLNMTEVYNLRRVQDGNFRYENKNPVVKELWLTVIKTPDDNGKNFVVRMIAPSRDQDFYNWAIATQAYQYIIESLQ